MADLRNFAITRLSNQNINAPRWQISGQVVEVDRGADSVVLRDFSGANSVTFPQVLGTLTNAQQDKLVEMIVMYLLEAKGIL
jgi:hypothetical protein